MCMTKIQILMKSKSYRLKKRCLNYGISFLLYYMRIQIFLVDTKPSSLSAARERFSVSEIPTVKKLVSGIPTSGMIKGVGNTDILFLLVEYIKRMICKVRPLAGRKWIAIEGKGGEELRKI